MVHQWDRCTRCGVTRFTYEAGHPCLDGDVHRWPIERRWGEWLLALWVAWWPLLIALAALAVAALLFGYGYWLGSVFPGDALP